MGQRSVFTGQRSLLLTIFLSSVFLNLLVLTVPLYMLQLFSKVLSSGSVSTLVVLSAGAGISIFFFFLFDAVRQRLTSRLGTRLEVNLGPTVLEVLVCGASATDIRGAQPIRDLQEVRRFVTGPAFISLLDAPWSVIFVGLIFLFHPVLGVIATSGLLMLLLLGIVSEVMGRKPNEASNEATQKANALVEEMIRNAEVVKPMAKTPALIGRWRALSNEALRSGIAVVDRTALMTSIARMVRMGLQIAMLGAGVLLVLDGQLSPGVMIAASILLGRAAAPVEQSIAGWQALLSARLAIRRLDTLLGDIKEGLLKVELPEPDCRLSVENATVVSAGRLDPLVFDITFGLNPGESLGIIGPSGSGKTTLARCLVGLQPLSRGFIRIDDAALADWPEEQIGRYVGFLPQRVELFNGTIAENISTMDPDAPSAAIVEAAKRAKVHNLILSLPGGYNADVGNRGELLSAGQRQRIGLARAFYGDRRLIVLDEPNANLDPEGEEALAEALEAATAEGTVVIIVTHRVSILRRVKYAALMDRGRIARFGASREIIDAVAQPISRHHAAGDAKITPLKRPRMQMRESGGGARG